MPWIYEALTSPETRIRPSLVRGGLDRESYVLVVPPVPGSGKSDEFFGVVVRKLAGLKEVAFITAYVLDKAKLQQVKDGGPLLYPAKSAKKRK
jgi:hypothetical protein